MVRHIPLCAGTAAITQHLPPLLAGYAALRPKVQVCIRPDADAAVLALRDFLIAPEQNAQSRHARFE